MINDSVQCSDVQKSKGAGTISVDLVDQCDQTPKEGEFIDPRTLDRMSWCRKTSRVNPT